MGHPKGFELAGHIGVDAGICWIGDPCYVIHSTDDNTEVLGKDWEEFCKKLGNSNVIKFPYAHGHEGLGVVVNTGYGDGFYPVYVRKVEGRVMEARVVFDEDGEED
jgi:hypothetical protein